MIYVWLVIAIGTLLLELGHPGLFLFLSVASGAAAASITALWASLTAQIAVCVLVTGISFLFLRKWAHQLHHKEVPSNAAALVGKQGIVIKSITPQMPGQVKINGEIWTARSNDTVFEPNTSVTVVRVTGSHVVVTTLQIQRKDVS